MSNDPVNQPDHYTKGGVECLVAIEASMSAEEFMGFLKGNVMKYIWRWRDKGGVEDLRKAVTYLGMMPSRVEKPQTPMPVLTAPVLPQTKAPSPILNPEPLSSQPLLQPTELGWFKYPQNSDCICAPSRFGVVAAGTPGEDVPF